MFFDGEYRLVTKVEVAALRAAVEALDEAEWYGDTSRQEAFPPHRHTQTIALIYDPDMRHSDPTVRPAFARFRHIVQPIMDEVAANYPVAPGGDEAAYFVRAILVRLTAGESIKTHRDYGDSLSRAHRIHIPVITNSGAEFGIDGHIKHLAAGEAWEINNRKHHAVRNNGTDDRVHLILDYVLPGETVEDPDGQLVA